MRILAAAALSVSVAACAGDGPEPGGPSDAGVDPGDGGVLSRECPALYAQDILPTFEIEITDGEWNKLVEEYENWEARQAQGLDVKPYHPIVFRHDGNVVDSAMLRLRGNPCCSWQDEKMQFQISFNEVDPDGRYMGLRKILLDAPRYNRSFLRERLALSILRDMGLRAPCANNARLVVNGAYYGLYTNVEKIDREFLERNFEDPDGDLFKKGAELKTNEETSNLARALEFWETTTIPEMEQLIDLEAMVLELAGEAIIPDNDGFWGGGGNFYVYDDPTSGKLVLLPWDLDSTFEVLPPETDPVTWIKPESYGRPHVDAIFADEHWRARYVEALRTARAAYDVDVVIDRLDRWAAQIHEAAATDPMKPFSTESHEITVQNMRTYIPLRAAFIDSWLAAQ